MPCPFSHVSPVQSWGPYRQSQAVSIRLRPEAAAPGECPRTCHRWSCASPRFCLLVLSHDHLLPSVHLRDGRAGRARVLSARALCSGRGFLRRLGSSDVQERAVGAFVAVPFSEERACLLPLVHQLALFARVFVRYLFGRGPLSRNAGVPTDGPFSSIYWKVRLRK